MSLLGGVPKRGAPAPVSPVEDKSVRVEPAAPVPAPVSAGPFVPVKVSPIRVVLAVDESTGADPVGVTDFTTKALSKLGFNADIFLGKFDDTKYVQQMKQEFKEPAKKQTFKEGGFDKALNSDQKTILSVLSKYELTPDQKKQLTEKLKTA